MWNRKTLTNLAPWALCIALGLLSTAAFGQTGQTNPSTLTLIGGNMSTVTGTCSAGAPWFTAFGPITLVEQTRKGVGTNQTLAYVQGGQPGRADLRMQCVQGGWENLYKQGSLSPVVAKTLIAVQAPACTFDSSSYTLDVGQPVTVTVKCSGGQPNFRSSSSGPYSVTPKSIAPNTAQATLTGLQAGQGNLPVFCTLGVGQTYPSYNEPIAKAPVTVKAPIVTRTPTPQRVGDTLPKPKF